MSQPNNFVLQVKDDSLKGDFIGKGDYVVMRDLLVDEKLNNGEIVAAIVNGTDTVVGYAPNILSMANHVKIRGVIVGVWRKVNVQ